MKRNKITCILLIFVLLFSTIFSFIAIADEQEKPEVINSGKYEGGYRYNSKGWIYLYIDGKAYDRGYQHGQLLAAEIVDHVTRWSNVIHASPAFEKKQIDFDSAKYEKLSNTWWNYCRKNINRIYWDRTPEEYQQEIIGIADGVKDRGGTIFGRDIDYIDILSINQMFEFMTRFDNSKKGFHPIRDLFNLIKGFLPSDSDLESSFIKSFLDTPPVHHCNAFIATGNATTEGQIVAAHNIRCGGWWYHYYVAQRWNVIIDINPEEGFRFTMASSPGFIWSDENYYQNEEGIIIMDTTCFQGLWKNKGYSMVIRTRMGIQYSSNLDQAIDYLMYKNDGLWTAAYLLGDTKTGEIARLDLALYNYGLWRTFDGYYWSANNPMDLGVRIEANGLGILGFLGKLINMPYYEFSYFSYVPAPRDKKIEELAEENYGKIDIEVLKNVIMYEYPVTDEATTDIKATDTRLIEENSLWAFFGNARGMVWDVSDQENNLKGARDVPPNGWAFIAGLPEGHDAELPDNIWYEYERPYNSRTVWEYDFAKGFEGRNSWYADLTISDDILFASCLDGNISALTLDEGEKLWKKNISDFDKVNYINSDEEMLFVGSENKSFALNQENGIQIWTNEEIKYICSKPVIKDDKVIFSNRNGEIFSVKKDNGKIIWKTKLETQKTYTSIDLKNDNLIVANDKKIYSIDCDNGEIIWTFDSFGLVISQPLIVKDTIYFGSTDTNVYALELRNGELKWKHSTGWSVSNTPACSDDKLYVSSADHNLYALDCKNGEEIWSFKSNAAVHTSPVVYGEYVFFGSDDGWFYANNKSTGKAEWCYSANYTIDNDIYNYITTPFSGNIIAKNKMIFTSANGYVIGLEAQTFEKEVKKEKQTSIIEENFYYILILIALIVVIAVAVIIKKIKS